MGAGGMFILGGLLQGAGQAITNNANALREEALANLKHQYDIEDRTVNNDAAMARTQAEIQGRKDEIGLTGQANIATEKARGLVEQSNILLRGTVDLQKDTQLEKLRHANKVSEAEYQSALDMEKELKLAGYKVGSHEVTTDGKIVFFNEHGDPLRYSANPNSFVPTGAGNADQGDLSGLLNPSGVKAAGAPPASSSSSAAPKASPGSNNVKAQAKAQLGNIYMKIASDPAQKAQYQKQYPGMFDAAGNLLPKEVLLARVDQRYGD